MKKLFAIISIILLIFSPKFANASHVSGGEITYTSLGGNQYKVVLVNYWDCSAFDPGPSLSVTANNTCSLASFTFTVNLDSAMEISQICPSMLIQTSCSGGTLPGNKKNVYSAVVTLPGACSQWTFEHTSCCRNTSINVPTQPSYTFYATLNNLVAPNNNSPYFTSQPLPYMCINQPVCYSPGVVEVDGNTLSYSLVSAMDINSTTPVAYAAGYSGTAPMPGITISTTTGLISFTPTMIGNFVVSFLVTEKDQNGVVIGTVIRDIQMVVVNCTNQVIPCNSGGIFNLTGTGATATGSNSMQICENIPFSFQMSFTDPDAANILSFTSNIAQVLPGSIITSSGTNPILINVSWTAPPGSSGSNTTFALTISDNACPVTGQQTVNYIIDVLSATNAGPDVIKCGNQSVQLHGEGPGNVYNWTVLSGPPMVVGTNFSCNPCQNPLASPTATTTYLLTCNGGNGCILTDTMTINVVPDFGFSMTQSSTSSCLLQPIQLGVTNLTPPGSGYTFNWSPSTYLSNPAIANPVANITTPGTYTYTVTVTNPFGCVKKDSLTVSVIPAVTPIITAYADTAFCAGGTATLGVTFGTGVPTQCGLSMTGGCAGSIPTTIGTGLGSNTSTTFPAPFGNWYTSVRQQYLFTAAELNAAGIVGGKIDRIDINVTAINGIAAYHLYTVNMGCTNLASFNSTTPAWATGLVNVFTPQTVNIIVGANPIVFNTAYEWDGISNLVVEVCFSELNPSANYTSNSVTPFTTTGFTSCLYSLSDGVLQCTDPAAFIQSTSSRPDLVFHHCGVIANPANYSYNWVPASGNIANSALQNTTAQPMASTTFTVTVTDIAGGCSTTDSVQVNVTNINSLTVTPAGPYCVNGPTDTLQVSLPPGSGGTWFGPGITNSTLGIFDPAVAGVGATHQIYYLISGSCGTASDTINIVVGPQPDATITPVASICTAAGPITLSAVTPGGVWSGMGITNSATGAFDPAIAGVGNHIISYNISTPCTAVDTVVINVISQLNATITSPNGPYCTTSPAVTLTAVDPSGTWTGTGITDPVLGTFDPATAGAGSHTITYTITGFCGVTGYDTIKVIANPVISFTSDKNEGCQPTQIAFTSTATPPGGSCYWTFGDAAGSTSTLCDPIFTYSDVGDYTVSYKYTIPPGCSTTITKVDSIQVHSQPDAHFISTPQPTDIVNPEVHFIDYSTGLVDSWNWTFGTNGINGTSLMQNPSVVFPDTGTYAVQLIVRNIYGCADTVPGSVRIDQIVTFYAPNAFTPNGNGNNDLFMVKGDGIDYDNFEIDIFDRWGELVYKSNDMFEGWNGKFKNTGEPVDQAVYVWRVYFKDFQKTKHYYIGDVTLIR